MIRENHHTFDYFKVRLQIRTGAQMQDRIKIILITFSSLLTYHFFIFPLEFLYDNQSEYRLNGVLNKPGRPPQVQPFDSVSFHHITECFYERVLICQRFILLVESLDAINRHNEESIYD